MSPEKFDVAIVGAGIVGLAHAYHLGKAGYRVAVFERNAKAVGASIRNFGMIWPIGQPPGEMREMALVSREHWLTALEESGIWYRKSGSLHLAYHDDELGVLSEFVFKACDRGYACELLSPAAARKVSPVIRPQGLVGALWSADELCVYPRQVIAEFPGYLHRSFGVEFFFGRAVRHIEGRTLFAGEEQYEVGWTIVCPGDDLNTLFKDRLQTEGVGLCKLQMLRARPLQAGFDLGCHLCAGLTLGHYANFRICERLEGLKERFATDLPEHVRWGIHLLVSQHEDGFLTIGDSHEYLEAADPFLREEVELLMLSYLDTFLPVSNLEITERWHGVYAKHPSKSYVLDQTVPAVTLVAALGGAGMTLSFGIAKHVLAQIGLLN